MVLISEISNEVARITGREPATMKEASRHLRVADMLSQKGRGRSAAHATPLDAAHLLIAGMVVTEPLKEAPKTVRHYSDLVMIGQRTDINGHVLDRGCKFAPTLATLFEIIAEIGPDPHLWGYLELNLSARRATISQTNDSIFDGRNPPADIPDAQLRNQIEFPGLLVLASMVSD